MVISTWFYGPRTTIFAHKVFISTTFLTQFLYQMTYFRHRHLWRNCYFSDANYSIKRNNKVLLYGILQIDVCLRFQNLKKNWKLVHKQGCYSFFCKVCFKSSELLMEIATFQMQITQKNTIFRHYFMLFYRYMCLREFRILKKIKIGSQIKVLEPFP